MGGIPAPIQASLGVGKWLAILGKAKNPRLVFCPSVVIP
jgi:hypothetical protein